MAMAMCDLPLCKALHNGKTHLAIALGPKACAAKKRVLFIHSTALLEQPIAGTVDRSLGTKLDFLARLDL